MRLNVLSSPRVWLALVSVLLLSTSAFGQKAPELGYVFPPVVRAGETTTVQLGGYDFTPDLQFFVHHQSIRMKVLAPPGPFLVPGPPYWFGEKGRRTAFPIPREVPARITVPEMTPSGVVHWQVANANGSSRTALFCVSAGNEMVEKRLRDEPIQLDELPVSVSGRLEKITEVDRYQFTADRDGPITLDLMARRLGSDFHGSLELRDQSGKVLGSSADTEGRDLTLTFAAKKGQTYEARLHDIDFRGNRAFVYRLSVTPQPRVITTVPAHGQRGRSTEVTFVGQGIATGEAKLETMRRQVTFPKDADLTTFRYSLKTSFGSVQVPIPLSDVNEITELADLSKGDAKLSLPVAVTGALSQSAEEDRYVFHCTKGQQWRITLQSQAIGAALDVELQVLGPNGKSLALVDDVAGTPDAGARLKAPTEGDYTCIVRDTSGHDGNLAAIYRLEIVPQEPDFALTAPQQINVALGGKSQVPIKVQRFGGFTGPILLRVEGLPEGVTCDKTLTIPEGKTAFKLSLEHAKDAAVTADRIRIVGQGQIDDRQVTRLASATATGNRCPRTPGESQTSDLLLCVTMKPTFAVELVDRNRQRAVHRGTTYRAEFLIKREEGFTGEVQLQMAARQGRHRQGISGPIVKVAPNAGRALYPCFMPEWLETDRTTRMVVLGVARVMDPRGNLRYLTKPADARITMILEGALLKLSSDAPELTVHPGETFEVPVAVSQSAKLQQEVRIELVGPSEILDVVRAQPITLSPTDREGTLKIQTTADARLNGDWPITLRATALQEKRWRVVSQTVVSVRFTSPRK